ncbi:MAG: glutamate--cysteine ligase [Aeromicrobium sp.]
MTPTRKVGVEEEMFLVDPRTRLLVPASGRALDAADSGDQLEQELFLQQVETASAPHHAMADLLPDLRAARRGAIDAAASVGAVLAAMPVAVLADDDGEVTPKQRYERMVTRFGQVGQQALVCGTHVHVDVADDDEGVGVIDRMAPWLPLVLALSTGSPFHAGADTGYASWRAETWESWPTAGAVEPFGDAAGYHRAVAAVIDAGAALDGGMIYFDARLSAAYPTVEIRVADVCADLADTVVITAVLRSLVETCAEWWHDGTPVDPWRVEMLRAARWRARRDGLDGSLIDPAHGRLTSARHALDTLVRTIGPALDRHGDRELVERGIDRLLTDGTGATRQRTAAGPDVDLVAVVDDVIARTEASAGE